MRLPLAAAVLAAALAPRVLAAPAEVKREFVELPPGRYAITLKGMLCAVCARSIAAEWRKLPEVQAADVKLDQAKGELTVRLDRTLKVAALVKALRRAEKTANLGATYELTGIAYRLESGR